MNCQNPTLAYQDLIRFSSNGAHPVVVVGSVDPFSPLPESGQDRKYFHLPCGKCLLCRKRRAQEIAVRAMFEIKSYDPHVRHSFVTLTVSDDNLEKVFPSQLIKLHDENGKAFDFRYCPRLDHRPFQLFMKRLRKRGVECRYLMCGEYGERTHRPHYHAILFGWYPSDPYIDKRGCFHASEMLEEIWPYGHITIDEVNDNRVFYVAGYTLKGSSIKQPEWLPYVRWSRRPGLGSQFIDENMNLILKKDVDWLVNQKQLSYYYRTFVGRKELRFGSRYLDSRLRLHDSEKFDTIKASRQSRILIETQKLDSSKELRALAASSLMNKVKSLDYQLARKSRELKLYVV